MDDLPAQLRDYIDGVAAPVELTEVVARGRGEGATAGPDGSRPERAYLLGHTDHEMVTVARPRTPRRRAIAALAAVAAVIVVTIAVAVTRPSSHHQPEPPVAPPPSPAPSVQPQLYWRDATGIGRANLDGTGTVRQLIPFNVGVNQGSGLENGGCGLAVDHNYVYWPTGDTLARAKLDGTGIDTGFIVTGPGMNCVAVDRGHIYWATAADATSGGTIGRANLDGTGVQRAFIPEAKESCGLAVDGAHVYWGNSSTGSIGRANLDGTGVNQDFIPGLGVPAPSTFACGVVVDRSHIYWGAGSVTPPGTSPQSCNDCYAIGQANLDGSSPGMGSATAYGPFLAFSLPCADDGRYLYWTYSWSAGASWPGYAWIGRAKLDSSGSIGPGNPVQSDFIDANAPGGASHVPTISGCAIQPVAPTPSPTPAAQPSPVVSPLSPTAVAQPQLYWQDGDGIGRANVDGTGITRQLIPVGGEAICGGTVAADHNYVYWTIPGPAALADRRPGNNWGEIARARRDGTAVDQSFITTTSPYVPQCVAVDGAHVYWTSILGEGPNAQFAIGRANLDGTGVNETFIGGPGASGSQPCAEDGAYLYWSSGPSSVPEGLHQFDRGSIGRARLDGRGGVQDGFISGLNTGVNSPGCAIRP